MVDFDFSACGGTHCIATGTIGIIKIVRTERQNKKLRIFFVAGQQALTYFQQVHRVTTQIANELSSGIDDLPQLVRQQATQLKRLQREFRQQKTALLPLEAEQLAAQARQVGRISLVMASFEERSAGELRELGKLLLLRPGFVAFLAAINENKLALVVSCADDAGLSAQELLTRQLAAIDGRGGGDKKLAQGGGVVTSDQVATFFETTPQLISELSV